MRRDVENRALVFPQIYDECTFSADAMIAHATFPIPDDVVHRGVVVDEWWPLSGQEGPDKEGMVHLVRNPVYGPGDCTLKLH